jgi:hypothetical protein
MGRSRGGVTKMPSPTPEHRTSRRRRLAHKWMVKKNLGKWSF